MSLNTWSVDDEGIQLTYSTLPPVSLGKRTHTMPATLPRNGEPNLGGPGSVRTSRSAWPRTYHRVLTGTFLGALFALGLVLGMVVSGSAVSVYSPDRSQPSSSPTLAPPGGSTNTTQVAHPGTGGDGGGPILAAVDARFAIVTLGIRCLPDLCDGRQHVLAGQRVYALEGGASCTTLSATEVIGQRAQAIYCRLDQPSVFTASFDGTSFDCVGSRLGCHFVMRVETTNGR